MTAFALVLLLGAAAAWIASGGAPPRARTYLRLASVLYATFAFSEAVHAAPGAVGDIVSTLGPVVLAVAAFAAFRHRPRWFTAASLMAAAALCGIAAAATDWRAMAAVPQVLAAFFTFLVARPGLATRPSMWRKASVYLALSVISIVAAAALALVPGPAAHAGLLLFAGTGVLGVALASNLAVKPDGANGGRRAIRRAR